MTQRLPTLAALSLVLAACSGEKEGSAQPEGQDTGAEAEVVYEDLPDSRAQEPDEPIEIAGPVDDLAYALLESAPNELAGQEVDLERVEVASVNGAKVMSVTSQGQGVIVVLEEGATTTEGLSAGDFVALRGRFFTSELGTPRGLPPLPAEARLFILAEEVSPAEAE